jgi:integrase
MSDGIYKRGGVWWQWDPVTGKRKSTGYKDRKAAGLYHRRRQRLAADPAHAAAEASLIKDWAAKVLEQKRSHKSAGTAAFYSHKLGHIVRVFGEGATMSAITPDSVDALVKQRLAEGAAPNSVAKDLTALFQICKMAKRSGAYAGDVHTLRPTDFSPEYVPRDRWLPPQELFALLCALPPARAAHVALIVATGARLSEALKVRPDDVDCERWLVRLRGTKTARADRTVPVPEERMRRLLLAALPWLPVVQWGNMTRDLELGCTKAGIAKASSNDLRRTCGSWLIQAGVEASLVARILGHADSRMVERVYGRMRPEHIGRVARSQISTTASHDAAEGPANPRNVQVAQSVEQRTENPGDWAEAIGDVSGYADLIVRAGPVDAAQVRSVQHNRVTLSPSWESDALTAADVEHQRIRGQLAIKRAGEASARLEAEILESETESA